MEVVEKLEVLRLEDRSDGTGRQTEVAYVVPNYPVTT
jgi:hypothetical protein